MSNTELLLTVILLQQSLFGLFWLGAARVRLARGPSLHWAAMVWLVAGGVALILLRGQAPLWLSVGVSNGLLMMAFMMLRRGIQRFARLPVTDREHGLLLGVAALGATVTAVAGLKPLPAVLLAASVMAWTLARVAIEIRASLADEFGTTAATWCASPMALLAFLLIVRGGVAVLKPARFESYLNQPGGTGVLAAFIAVVIAMLLQATLMTLVLLRLVRRLQYQSDHDLLTGLLSRRPMEKLLLSESQRQRRFGGSFALLSVDIDHFKDVNDRYGHAAGDAVLKRVADALRAAARDMDSVARMGGEEFCVLLPGTDAAGADRVAARMLETVQGLHHPETGGGPPTTISIGLAVVDLPVEPIPAVQRRLDQALYRAKAAGRNRVELAWPAAHPA
jgi:diguanylate cyclase (GGDEF)-like protein